MKVIIEGKAKEIAALVLELQERHGDQKIGNFETDGLGVHLCADDILKD